MIPIPSFDSKFQGSEVPRFRIEPFCFLLPNSCSTIKFLRFSNGQFFKSNVKFGSDLKSDEHSFLGNVLGALNTANFTGNYFFVPQLHSKLIKYAATKYLCLFYCIYMHSSRRSLQICPESRFR